MPIPSLPVFALEEFFDLYEHRGDLINLASSDGLPWSVAELQRNGVSWPTSPDTGMHYPDTRTALIPRLTRFCDPPPGFGVLPTSGAAEAMALVMHEISSTDDGADKRPVGIPRPAFGAFRGLASMLGIEVETTTTSRLVAGLQM
jgi:aspartate/methionine/tyrosine aminotransferase